MSNKRTDVAKVQSGGRVTIPHETRKDLDIDEGDYIVIEVSKIDAIPD